MPYAHVMGTGSGSKAGAGCGAFGLVGLLISVGIVAWLFVTSTDMFTSDARNPRPTTAQVATTAVAPTTAIALAVTPAHGLGADAEVRIAATGWAPDSEVTISTCLSGAGLVVGPDDSCGRESTVTQAADASGAIDVTYRVDRVIHAGGLPFDCADRGTTCVVRAIGTDADERTASGHTAVAFGPDLPAPDLLEEFGS